MLTFSPNRINCDISFCFTMLTFESYHALALVVLVVSSQQSYKRFSFVLLFCIRSQELTSLNFNLQLTHHCFNLLDLSPLLILVSHLPNPVAFFVYLFVCISNRVDMITVIACNVMMFDSTFHYFNFRFHT